MNITMHDIARATGVSQSTVSRILNDNPNVKPEKKKKVLDYIEKVGYRPNLLAKSLKNNNSYLIGVCVPDLLNPYFYEIIETLETLGRKNKYSIIIHNSKNNPILEWEGIMDFVDRQVDGIILVPRSNLNTDKLKELKIPSVIVTQIKKGIDSVSVCHKSGGKLAAKHLLNLGHQKVGFIGGSLETDEKFMGFYKEIEDSGMEFSMNNYLNIPDYSYSKKEIESIVYKYIKTHKENLPTAFFAGNDIIAFETMKVLDDFGIKVPEDISIIGFDDTVIAKALKISSIKQPIEDISKISFEILLNKIKNDKTESDVNQIQLEPILFQRKTTKIIKHL